MNKKALKILKSWKQQLDYLHEGWGSEERDLEYKYLQRVI